MTNFMLWGLKDFMIERGITLRYQRFVLKGFKCRVNGLVSYYYCFCIGYYIISTVQYSTYLTNRNYTHKKKQTDYWSITFRSARPYNRERSDGEKQKTKNKPLKTKERKSLLPFRKNLFLDHQSPLLLNQGFAPAKPDREQLEWQKIDPGKDHYCIWLS